MNHSSFFSTMQVWDDYSAVGFQEAAGSIESLDKDSITASFQKTLDNYVSQIIYLQERAIKDKISSAARKHIYQSQLGVLHARYGPYDRALGQFETINRAETTFHLF